jgi:hypothetical protein
MLGRREHRWNRTTWSDARADVEAGAANLGCHTPGRVPLISRKNLTDASVEPGNEQSKRRGRDHDRLSGDLRTDTEGPNPLTDSSRSFASRSQISHDKG